MAAKAKELQECCKGKLVNDVKKERNMQISKNANSYIKELDDIREIRKLINKSQRISTKGRLRCEMSKGKYPQYYIMDSEFCETHPNGRYLRRDEIQLAKALAQQEYDRKILKEINKREREINLLLSVNEEPLANIRDVYRRMPLAKQILIEPYVLTDEEYVEKWICSHEGNQNSYPINSGILTERGELVRTKSEKILADKLFLRNVPYIYEPECRFDDASVVFPDFVALNVRTKEEFYLEHFGMMDTPEYCKRALEKIDLYEENEIMLGEKLLATFESNLKPINPKQIDLLIDRYLV